MPDFSFASCNMSGTVVTQYVSDTFAVFDASVAVNVLNASTGANIAGVDITPHSDTITAPRWVPLPTSAQAGPGGTYTVSPPSAISGLIFSTNVTRAFEADVTVYLSAPSLAFMQYSKLYGMCYPSGTGTAQWVLSTNTIYATAQGPAPIFTFSINPLNGQLSYAAANVQVSNSPSGEIQFTAVAYPAL